MLHSKGGSHKDTLLCTPLLWDTPQVRVHRWLRWMGVWGLHPAGVEGEGVVGDGVLVGEGEVGKFRRAPGPADQARGVDCMNVWTQG